ncbi:MAG: hypothetical protein LBC85_05720, partial [Fibromonadaceae bacterium]|nr:hypothetical protein [Fibromonadaceae bacterium]
MQRKLFLLPLFAIAVFVGQASAQEMCLYSSGACWPRSGDPGCQAHGWVFNGGLEGHGTLCAGGTFTGEGIDQNPPTSVGVSLGCCRWAEDNPQGQCWDVFTSAQVS